MPGCCRERGDLDLPRPLMPQPPCFNDIEAHWAEACIKALAERGLVSGYPDGSFRPEDMVTRAEAAALLLRAFPDAPVVGAAIPFLDVSANFWASQAIQWATERGFFSDHPDQTFQPARPLTRGQALVVLSSGLKLAVPQVALPILSRHYDDVASAPAWAVGAIAAATEAKLVVCAPDPRQLRADQPASRATMAAFLCRALAIADTVPFPFIAWDLLLEEITTGIEIHLDELDHRASLVRELQRRLHQLRLYPGDRWLDGIVGPRMRAALGKFARLRNLTGGLNGLIDEQYARALLSIEPVPFVLEQARDRSGIHADYLHQEEGFDAENLAFLDRGARGSPVADQMAHFPDRLRVAPDQIEMVSWDVSTPQVDSRPPVAFTPYPERGVLPAIDGSGLEFLHADVQRACLCVGRVEEGRMRTHWLGRQALANGELWSCTKIIPLLQVVGESNAQFPGVDLDGALIRPLGEGGGHGFHPMAVDIFSYAKTIGTSNAIAAMFKQFSSPDALEQWLKQVTGNAGLTFRGRYGEPPFLVSPQLWDDRSGRELLRSADSSHDGSNSISTYDLVRMISLLGWHPHLPLAARLPGARWDSLQSVVMASAMDTARYVDVALDRLNLYGVIQSPVILSKLGFGRSAIRDRTELAYVALVQFIDKRPWAEGRPAVMRTLAMALIAAMDLGDPDQEARALDARMAAEVTEILRRFVTQELV